MHLARELMLKATVKAPLAVVRSTLIYGEGDPHNGYDPPASAGWRRQGRRSCCLAKSLSTSEFQSL